MNVFFQFELSAQGGLWDLKNFQNPLQLMLNSNHLTIVIIIRKKFKKKSVTHNFPVVFYSYRF